MKYCITILTNYYVKGLVQHDFRLDKVENKDKFILHADKAIFAIGSLDELKGYCLGIQAVTSVSGVWTGSYVGYFSENLWGYIDNE